MNENQIINFIYYQVGNKNTCIPRCHFRCWERDFLQITSAGYAHEFEIKRTLSDLKADKKKKRERHKHINYKWAKIDPAFKLDEEPKQVSTFSYVITFDLKDLGLIPDYAGLYRLYAGKDKEAIWPGDHWICKRKPKRLPAPELKAHELNRIMKNFQYRYWDLRLKLSNK